MFSNKAYQEKQQSLAEKKTSKKRGKKVLPEKGKLSCTFLTL